MKHQGEENKCSGCAMKRGSCPALTSNITPSEREDLCKETFVMKTDETAVLQRVSHGY